MYSINTYVTFCSQAEIMHFFLQYFLLETFSYEDRVQKARIFFISMKWIIFYIPCKLFHEKNITPQIRFIGCFLGHHSS
jgi:hypothetical protein